MDYSALAPYFKHYDNLVSRWLDEEDSLCEGYLPEPWWGWCDADTPLYGVVVNYNPGEGGWPQRRKCIRCAFGDDFQYRESMVDGSLVRHLPDTAKWHRQKRELPMLKAVGQCKEKATIDKLSSSPSTLSIELFPFHSANPNKERIKKYLSANDGEHLKRVLGFATKVSTFITGKLQHYVLIRICGPMFKDLTDDVIEFSKDPHIIEYPNDNKGAKAEVFQFAGGLFENVKFVCIWSSGSRNNFPSKLPELLKEITSAPNNKINTITLKNNKT